MTAIAESDIKYEKIDGGTDTLMKVGKSQSEMAAAAKSESANYDKIKNAIKNGRLSEGDAARDIIKRYGEPVVMLPARKGRPEKWVYKPAGAEFFSNEKIYLFFDENGGLLKWQDLS